MTEQQLFNEMLDREEAVEAVKDLQSNEDSESVFDGLEGRFKPSSIKDQKRFFKRVIGVANDNDLDFRKDAKQLLKQLDTQKRQDGTKAFKISTQRTYIKAMLNFFMLKKEVKTKHYNEYKDRLDEIETEIESKPKQLTEKQKDIDFNKGLAKFLKFVEENDFDISEEPRVVLILSFILLFGARRLDWVGMKYSKTFKNLDSKTNYLVEGRKYWTFVFNVFKTDKSFRQQKFRIENPILIKILENMDFGDFVYDQSKRTFQRQLAKQSLRFFDRDLSVQDYRVIIASEEAKEFKDFLKELKKKSDISAHQIGTRIKTYIRDI